MKRFRDFKIDPILITAQPVHGAHAVPKSKKAPIVIDAIPVHGKHSRAKIRESRESSKAISSDDWIDSHENNHLGEDHYKVRDKIQLSDEDWDKHPHNEAVKRYTDNSRHINERLIANAKGETHWTQVPHFPHFKSHPSDVKHPSDAGYKVASKMASNKLNMRTKADPFRLDKAIAHKPLEHDLHVYHGTSTWNPGALASKHPDRLVKSPAFISSSIDKDRAYRFTTRDENSHVLHIHLKKGQKALPILQHSNHPREHEVLLPRDTVLKIHPKPIKLSCGTHVWHAEVHDQ